MQHSRNLNRREALAVLGRVCSCAAALGLGRCSGPPSGPATAALSVPLEELPDGQRVRKLLGTEPVEFLRRGESVRARSLLCSHVGCEVEWKPAEAYYQCPCHDGRYGPDGQVLSGPPPLPLEDLETRVQDGQVTLLPRGA